MTVTRAGLRLALCRELRRISRRRLHALLLVVLPLAGWLTLGAVFSQRLPRNLPIAVVDGDGSALSRSITRALDATPSLSVRRAGADPAAAEPALVRGDAYAVVIIPPGLEHGVHRADAPPVTLLYNAQWVVPSTVMLRDVRAAVAAVSLQVEASQRTARSMPAAMAGAVSQPIRAELHPLFNPSLDYSAFLFLALVPALFHMFVLLMTVEAAGRELKHATARGWLRSAGGSVWRALAGKMLPCSVWFAVMGSAQIELSLHWIGVEVAGSRLLLHTALLLMVFAYQAMGLLLVAATANLRLALTAAALIAAPSFAVVGVTFPLLSMPLSARLWAGALPLTHYVAAQTGQVMTGAPAQALLPHLVALAAFIIGGTTIALLRFPALMQDARYWGRT